MNGRVYSMVLLTSLSLGAFLRAQTPGREIAITIDDLPAAGAGVSGMETLDMTAKLLGTLRDQKVPVVGFVNERKLYR
ncbi:MAG TPA: hypothetical protein VJS37_05385, partial [Terriglobales bacterium]|nr:hypothetical protein [Terriglobales bacterium]